jgi:probable addiction module antidote protein
VRQYRKYRDALVEDLRNNPEETHAYLEAVLEDFDKDGNTEALLLALRTVAEAQGGIPKLAERIGMEKMTLYKALSENGNPRLSTIWPILHGLGYKLKLEPFSVA